METQTKQSIVFAYWKDGQLMGFRADTFGTIHKHPKIYTYSEEQVQIVLDNTKYSCNSAGTAFMKMLADKGAQVINGNTGEEVEDDFLVSHVSKTEKQLIEWGDFELRVHPFIDMEDSYMYPELWKVDAEINNLKDAIGIHKFKVLKDGNQN